MDLVGLSLFIMSGGVFVYMLYSYIRIAIKNKEMFHTLVQAEVDKKAILEKLEKMVNTRDERKVEESEAFLKFLTKSREWAFEYIEEVQQVLTEAIDFRSTLEEEIIYLTSEESEKLNNIFKKIADKMPSGND